MAGSGPEYDYPVTRKDEPIPVVGNEDPVAEAGMPVVGEDAREMNDKDIAGKIDYQSVSIAYNSQVICDHVSLQYCDPSSDLLQLKSCLC